MYTANTTLPEGLDGLVRTKSLMANQPMSLLYLSKLNLCLSVFGYLAKIIVTTANAVLEFRNCVYHNLLLITSSIFCAFNFIVGPLL